MEKINTTYLVDDDPLVNIINEKILKKGLFAQNIKSFTEPEKALAKLEYLMTNQPAEFPDIIFLDINMPVIDGWSFLEALEKLPVSFPSECKIFILSSSIDPHDIEKSKTYKLICGYISKPLNIDKLLSIKT